MTRPVQERIMSTSSWPVPYYKRIVKAKPAANSRKFNLDGREHLIEDGDVVDLKFKMELDPKRRDIMIAYENNVKTNSKYL